MDVDNPHDQTAEEIQYSDEASHPVDILCILMYPDQFVPLPWKLWPRSRHSLVPEVHFQLLSTAVPSKMWSDLIFVLMVRQPAMMCSIDAANFRRKTRNNFEFFDVRIMRPSTFFRRMTYGLLLSSGGRKR